MHWKNYVYDNYDHKVGFLRISTYAKRAVCSTDSALRDLQDLAGKEILKSEFSGKKPITWLLTLIIKEYQRYKQPNEHIKQKQTKNLHQELKRAMKKSVLFFTSQLTLIKTPDIASGFFLMHENTRKHQLCKIV